MIYVASSWRNERHGQVVQALRKAGLEVYDFKEPSTCFKWTDVMDHPEHEGNLTPEEYFQALAHPKASAGFNQDMTMLMQATTVILVHPCGRSAHLEMGYAVGQNKHVALLVENPVRDMDLMVLMIENLYSHIELLIPWAIDSERQAAQI